MKNLPVGEQSGRQIPACRVEGIAFYLYHINAIERIQWKKVFGGKDDIKAVFFCGMDRIDGIN